VKRALLFAAVAALSVVGLGQAAPITKQNGSSPVLQFRSICALSTYVNYGFCGGDPNKFADVEGKLNAVQPKLGQYNLDFSFKNLTPGVEYRLWSNDGAGWVAVGQAFADESGAVSYKLQTENPNGLGFDLNTVSGNITIMTSWWSSQQLVKKADGMLSSVS
jgi:hypothetical protein